MQDSNKKEQDSGYYDKFFTESKAYNNSDYTENTYYQLWVQALAWIGDREAIVELGCGTGQFAKMAIDRGKEYIFGCDFSRTAIDIAKQINPEQEELFYIGCIHNEETYKKIPQHKHPCYCIFEVLEHIDKDIEVFKNIPSGTRILLSVPDFWSESHVRVFANIEEIKQRYSGILNIFQDFTYIFKSGIKIFLCDATKI